MKELADIIYYYTGIVFDDEKLKRSTMLKNFLKEHNLALHALPQALKRRDLLQKFIDTITVSESYFFREYEAIEFIAKKYQSKQTILSLPCGCGEEPYSIEIALLERGVSSFLIRGADINRSSLQRAKEAKYFPRKLQNIPEEIRKKYFLYRDGYFYLKEDYKRVRFMHKNIFDLHDCVSYDYIFCRNLFIYFDEHKIRKALNELVAILKPQGYLIVGKSDRVVELPDSLKPVKNSIYQKI